MISIGGGYTDFQYGDMPGYFTKAGAFETVPNDNFNINTGCSYRINNMITATFGYMHTFYKDEDVKALLAQPLDVTVKTKNSIDAIALGIDLKF
jgi:long-subunit fatty acid transport protein